MKDKVIVVGVTGGIAAYKAAALVSMLKKEGAEVHVAMTKNACEFVAPLTFETLSNNAVTVDTFAEKNAYDPRHISIAQKAQLFIIAPASANFIGKYTHGIADDFLTTAVMAARCPALVCPAMNTAMLESAAVAENIETLKRRGVYFLFGGEGRLACGDSGAGRMAEPEEIISAAREILTTRRIAAWRPAVSLLSAGDYNGKTVLVTAGGTTEDIDRVRFIGNNSSGKMGIALAENAQCRGARVLLVAANVSAPLPQESPTMEIARVKTTAEMKDAVEKLLPRADYIIKAAAPADYRPGEKYPQKIKGGNFTLKLVKNPDIAEYAGKNKTPGQRLVIFCAETENLVENAKQKLKKKNADMVVANDVTIPGAGFNSDDNAVVIIDKKGNGETVPLMSKKQLAGIILDKLLKL